MELKLALFVCSMYMPLLSSLLLFYSLQIEANNTAFFPTLRARCLKKEDDTTKEDIADLKDMMQVLLDTFKVGYATITIAQYCASYCYANWPTKQLQV